MNCLAPHSTVRKSHPLWTSRNARFFLWLELPLVSLSFVQSNALTFSGIKEWGAKSSHFTVYCSDKLFIIFLARFCGIKYLKKHGNVKRSYIPSRWAGTLSQWSIQMRDSEKQARQIVFLGQRSKLSIHSFPAPQSEVKNARWQCQFLVKVAADTLNFCIRLRTLTIRFIIRP